jgi:hypothetical protein
VALWEQSGVGGSPGQRTSRLSSFGFSGTIAHGAFGARGSAKTVRWVASTQSQGRATRASLFR